MEDGRSVAGCSYVVSGKENPDGFTETTWSSGFGEMGSKVSGKAVRSKYLSSPYRLKCTHVPAVLLSHESWEPQGRWKVGRHL